MIIEIRFVIEQIGNDVLSIVNLIVNWLFNEIEIPSERLEILYS